MPRKIVPLLGLLLAAAAHGETAGPPAPPSAKRSPAEQAAALYRAEYARASAITGCPPSRNGEIVVCGNDRSPYRVPLPDERALADHPRIATGEAPRAVDAGSPMPGPRGVGLTLSIPLALLLGQSATPAAPTLQGLGGER